MAVSSGNPFEVWQRTLIDQLWGQGWEFTRIEPPPPLIAWYTAGMLPELAAISIMQRCTKPTKKTRKAATKAKDTKEKDRFNLNCHYVLEKEIAGITTYYISRSQWTQDLAAAKFFTSPTHAKTEAHLLPNGHETGVGIRTINLTPARIEITNWSTE